MVLKENMAIKQMRMNFPLFSANFPSFPKLFPSGFGYEFSATARPRPGGFAKTDLREASAENGQLIIWGISPDGVRYLVNFTRRQRAL
jgi:hypothetical protein